MTGAAIPSEDQEQAWLVAWFRRQHPDRLIFAIPNGGHRHKATAAMLKATGVVAGVPDLCIPEPCGQYHGLYIEMKRTKGGKLSPEQKAWIEALKMRGYRAVVCPGAEEAKAAVNDYLGGLAGAPSRSSPPRGCRMAATPTRRAAGPVPGQGD